MKRTIVVIAAFFAIGSTSFAAGRYMITSTSQIKPAVLRTIESRAAADVPAPTEYPPHRVETSQACPVNEEPISGGFHWEGEGKFEVLGSYRNGNGWLIFGDSYGANENSRLIVSVICLPR